MIFSMKKIYKKEELNEEELENLILTHSLRFQEILDRGKEQIPEGKSMGHEDFWNEMEENT